MSNKDHGAETTALSQREQVELAQFSISGHSSEHLIARHRVIQDVMKKVMKDGTHFGIVPGTKERSLLKPGSETLLTTFAIAVEPEVEAISEPNGGFTYRVKAHGRHIASQRIIGVGVGEASTNEDKYAWRRAVSDTEFDYYERKDSTSVRIKFGYDRQRSSEYQVKQVRTNPADIANTVLKMAKKRAQIDLTLTALAASDMFTQDMEDLEGFRGNDAPPPQDYNVQSRQQSSGKPASNGEATPAQVGLIRKRLSSASKNEADLCHHFKVESVEALLKGQVNDALAWIDGAANG